MQEKTYMLSPLYSLPEKNLAEFIVGDQLDEEIHQFSNKEVHFLSNDKKGKLFMINPTIRHFLEFFTSPGTLESVIHSFAQKVQCTAEQISDAMKTFFEDMLKRGVLVDLETANRIHYIEEAETNSQTLFEVGERVDGYLIEKVISRRPLMELFLAANGNRKVVIKAARINERVEEQYLAEIIEDFSQEFKLMQEIGEHPNVCQFIALKSEGRKPYGIIEYAEGVSLRKFLLESKSDLATELDIIEQIFAAIAHVQNQKIIHGDIHASNFLVNERGEVKLIDFNLSNREYPQKDEILRRGGVYDYIPPEKARQNAFSFINKKADYCSEVFQLGVIMYFVLYKQLPFSGFTWAQLAEKICNFHPTLSPHTPSNEAIPEAMLQVLERALMKDPSDRYPTATALYRAFQKAHKIFSKSYES